MADITKLEKLRPCGRLETYSTARHHLGFYKSVGLTATYTSSTVFSAPLESLVFQALRQVIAKHPNLSAIPVNEEKSYPDVYFARLPEIDLRTCVDFRERADAFPKDGEADADLDALLAEQHSRDYKDEVGRKPFWRLVVVASASRPNEFSASWFFHHALADGMSTVLFHDSFLAALNSAAPEADVNPVVKSPTSALVPAFEDLHPMPISWSFFLQAIGAAIFPSIFNKRPAKLWTGNPIPTGDEPVPKFNYRTLVLSAETTKKLAQASREEKTSVTAALQALLAASLFASLPGEYEKVKIEGPISMRPFLDGVPEGQMTNAITNYAYLHQRLPPTSTDGVAKAEADALRYFSWDEARAVKSAIQAQVAKNGRDNGVALLKYVSDMPKFFTDKLGKPRNLTAEISNIGVYKPKESANEGSWSIGRMTFSPTPDITYGAFGITVVTGGDGNAVISFSWLDGAVEKELLAEVIDKFQKGIDGLTTG